METRGHADADTLLWRCSGATAARRAESPVERLRRLEARVLELEQRLPANHPQAPLC